MSTLRFTPTKSWTLRTGAHFDDFDFAPYQDLHNGSFYSITEAYGNKVYVFSDPILVPDFSMYYAEKIKSLYDKRLHDIYLKFMWLNPMAIDNVVLRMLIIGKVLRNFVFKVKQESKVLHTKCAWYPIFTHEEVAERFKTYDEDYWRYKTWTPDKKVFHLLEKENTLTREQKISISRIVRSKVNMKYMHLMIDNVVDMFIEHDQYTRLSTARIHKAEVVVNDKGLPVSYNTINTNYSEYAKNRIEQTNTARYFQSEHTTDKLASYLTMDPLSSDQVAKLFNVSKTTATIFNKIRNDEY